MDIRKNCPVCNKNLVAINYISKTGVTHYRSLCSACIREKKKIKPAVPLWYKSGYRKKPNCEKCGFRAKFINEQLRIFHLDGNLQNINRSNLKTICLNCQEEIFKTRLPWKPASIVPDF